MFDKKVVREILFNEYLTPLFRAKGFTKRGTRYYLHGEQGDCVYVEFQTSTSSGRHWYVFYVNRCIAPQPWLAYLEFSRYKSQTSFPDATSALIWSRVKNPDGQLDHWSISSIESAHECGDDILRILPAHLDELSELLDRHKFLQRLSTGPKLPGIYSKPFVEAMLLVDDGPSDRLDNLLVEVETEVPGSSFVEWAKERIRMSLGPPHRST